MNFWLLATYLSLFSTISCNYFFDNNRVNGLTREQWLRKCKNILHETGLVQVIFSIRDLCTQLRCLRDGHEAYIGFDFCMKSAVRCKYSEPDPTLPFPECCPKRECYGYGLMSVQKFMQNKREYGTEARIRKGNQDLMIV